MLTQLNRNWMISQESPMNSLIQFLPIEVLASQTNQEAEQTLGLVHTEQSFRNAKANMASASTSAAVESDSRRS